MTGCDQLDRVASTTEPTLGLGRKLQYVNGLRDCTLRFSLDLVRKSEIEGDVGSTASCGVLRPVRDEKLGPY